MRSRRLGQLNADVAWKSIFQDEDWMFKTGIGGTVNAGAALLLAFNALIFFPVAFAMAALINGYMLSIIRYKVLNSESKLPKWESWLELLLSGLTWMALQFSYWLVAALLCAIVLLLTTLTGAFSGPGPVFVVVGTFTSLLMVFILVSVGFLTSYLMVNYALEERTAAGYAIAKVLRRARINWKNFILAWLLSLGVVAVAFLVPIVTLLGIFLIPSTLFLSQAISVSLLAQVWGAEKQEGAN